MTLLGISLLDWSQIASNLLTAAALIAGGLWTYFNYFRGRVYGNRLDLSVSGQYIETGEGHYVLVELSVRNIGLSRFVVKESGDSILRISSSPIGAYLKDVAIHNAYFEHEGTFPILEHVGWIDAGETVSDRRILAVPEQNAGLWDAEVVLVSNKGIVWKARAIIARASPDLGVPGHA